ncbi:hypothetical protein NMY22_g18485 [Coprinellus aureogranulatus]|nr:hypothetical protein NMY22_g18485 [Coprinellus aureogranulatus]
MRRPGGLVFDGVEVPKRAGVKRSRDSPSTSSKRLDLSPRKTSRMRFRSASMVACSPIRDGTHFLADSPTASESFQSSTQGYPSSSIDTNASNQTQATPSTTSRAASTRGCHSIAQVKSRSRIRTIKKATATSMKKGMS